jgi:hypothetical protein
MAVTCNNNTVIPPMSRCLCPIAQLGECQTEDLSCSDLQSDALPLGAAWTQEFTSGIKVTGYVQHFNLSTSKGGGIARGRNRSGWRVRGSRSVQALKIGPVGIRKHYYRKHQSGMNRDQEIRGAKSKALLLLEREHCLCVMRENKHIGVARPKWSSRVVGICAPRSNHDRQTTGFLKRRYSGVGNCGFFCRH